MMSMPTWAFNQVQGKHPTLTEALECRNQTQFGTLTWIINGKSYTFEPNEWVYPPQSAHEAAAFGQLSSKKGHFSQIIKQDTNIIKLGQKTARHQCLAQIRRHDWKSEGFLQLTDPDEDYEELSDNAMISSTSEDSSAPLPAQGEVSELNACYGTIMAMDLKNDMFLVGDIFMRKYYSIFDRDNDRVGLAEAVR